MPPRSTDTDVSGWQDHVEASLVSHWRRRADTAYRAIRRATGVEPASLDVLLKAIESEGGEELRSRLHRARFPADGYEALVLTAAFDGGAFRVRAGVDAVTVLHRPDGSAFDAGPLAQALAVADATAVEQLRGLLAGAGIEPAEATGGTAPADPGLAVATGAMANMKLNGDPHDLIITDTGLLFVPCPAAPANGQARLRALLTTPDGVRGIAGLPGAHWLAFEDVAEVELRKTSPVRATVTGHDGDVTEFGWTWTGEQIGESDRDLELLLRDLGDPPEPPDAAGTSLAG